MNREVFFLKKLTYPIKYKGKCTDTNQSKYSILTCR